jgi:signal peptidase I
LNFLLLSSSFYAISLINPSLSGNSIVAKTQIPGAKSTVREYVEAIIIALILALIIRTFIIQAFKIPSGSMLPTLQIGDHLLVNKFMYGFREPFSGTVIIPVKEVRRNDIIVFRFPRDPKLDYIKRVIAVGGGYGGGPRQGCLCQR